MTSLDNKNDIEANFTDIEVNLTDINQLNNNNTASFESNNNKTEINCFKFIIIFLVLLFGLPLAICDIYYAYNDNSCVYSHVDKIDINLKEYLQVSSLLTICFLFIVILETLFYENLKDTFLLAIGAILLIPISIFNTVWNIIGGVIFWGYMDNSLCSNNVFNYVFASIVIKYVCIVFNLLTNNKNKKK